MQTARKIIIYLIMTGLIYLMAFSIETLSAHWAREPTVIFIGGLIVYYGYLLALRFNEGDSDEK